MNSNAAFEKAVRAQTLLGTYFGQLGDDCWSGPVSSCVFSVDSDAWLN